MPYCLTLDRLDSMFPIVYTKPACVQCTMTKRKLIDLGVSFAVADVTESDDTLEHVKSLGYLAAPVVELPELDPGVPDPVTGERVRHWSGYRPDLLEALV